MEKIYKCDYMDSGINFERNGIYVCCKTAHKGGGRLSLSDSYNDFDWDKAFELKKAWKEQIASGNPPEKCVGCSHIVETDKTVDNLALYFVDINSFVNCNSQCIYCDCWSMKDFHEFSLFPYFQKLFEKKLLKNSNHGYIQFAGGEPALMKDFEKIVDLCLKNGIERYIVNSNGIKFSKGIEKLLKHGKTNLFVSIDSGCSDTYKQIKRVPCFNKVVDNLKKYTKATKNSQSCVWSKFILVPGINDNEEEINKWYDLSLKIGIRAVVLDVERVWFMEHDRQITPELERLIAIIQNRCEKDNVKLDYYESLKCLYGIH